MKQWILFVLAMCLFGAAPASAQTTVIQYEVTNFDPGHGMSMIKLLDQHRAGFQLIADSVMAKPNRMVYVYCVVDGMVFETDSLDDALNGGTAISRYLWSKVGLKRCNVPRKLIAPPYPDSDRKIGGDNRKVLMEVVEFPQYLTQAEMERYVDSIFCNMPAAEVRVDTVVNYFAVSNAWIGGGLGYVGEKLLPVAYGRLGNNRLSFEAEGGASIYQEQRMFQEELDVYYRFVNVGLVWRPWLNHTLDALVGWQRFETYSTTYGRYAERREGPTFGARYSYRHLAFTAKYAPAEVSVRGKDVVDWDHGIYLSVSLFTSVKGGDQ